MKEKLSAIVPAAGQGERLGKGPKALVALAGRPLLCWCLETLQSSPWVDELVVAAPPEQESRTRALAQAYPKVRAVVPGGPHRQQSVANALPALSPDAAWVMVHDGARPLLDSRLVEDVVLTARAVGAAVAAIPVVDTIKLAEPLGRRVARTVPREGLWLVQTPQVFRRDWFEEAHRAAGAEGWLVTDDSALVEKLGYPVELVRASRYNLKITDADDLAWAETLVQGGETRVGLGFDIHRLVPDRPLILAGAHVPGEQGLAGHSDADVICHAVMDALLGAVGERDIGCHFPPGDPRYADAFSLGLLRQVAGIVKEKGYRPVNLDITVVAEHPRLAGYVAAMKENLSSVLGLNPQAVGIKATTAEGLGTLGRAEGIAAWAVCMIRRERVRP